MGNKFVNELKKTCQERLRENIEGKIVSKEGIELKLCHKWCIEKIEYKCLQNPQSEGVGEQKIRIQPVLN